MMGEGHRLGHLHVGEARHDGVQMLLGLGQQRLLHHDQAFLGAGTGGAYPEAEIGHHLVVARTRGMQPPGGGTDQFGEPRLDIEMNVFQLALEDEGSRGDFLLDRVQPAQDRLAVILGNDPFGRQHAAMGAASGQVFARQALVEID